MGTSNQHSAFSTGHMCDRTAALDVDRLGLRTKPHLQQWGLARLQD